jgi:membrane protein DedA with SNARE-associated domain
VRIVLVAAVVVVLPVTIVYPFAGPLMASVEDLGTMSPAGAFLAIIGVLLLDSVIPIPHGLVGALAAASLDWWLAFVAAWTGLTAASSVTYAIGRFAGRPLATRLVGRDEMELAEQRAERISAWLLFATRPVPVLGEVLLAAAGIARYPFRRFLLAVGSANAILTLVSTGIGRYFGVADSGNLALAAGIGIPLVGALGYGAVWLFMRSSQSR